MQHNLPAYQSGAWGVTAFLVAAILYFLFYSKDRLVAQAPEEKAGLAIERGSVTN